MNESITFQVFDHFANSSTVSLTLAWSYTCKLLNMGRKLKQSLEIPILTRELYIFARKDLCFGTGRKSFAKYFLSEFSVLKINVAKIISPVIYIRVLGWRILHVYFGSDISELHCRWGKWSGDKEKRRGWREDRRF